MDYAATVASTLQTNACAPNLNELARSAELWSRTVPGYWPFTSPNEDSWTDWDAAALFQRALWAEQQILTFTRLDEDSKCSYCLNHGKSVSRSLLKPCCRLAFFGFSDVPGCSLGEVRFGLADLNGLSGRAIRTFRSGVGFFMYLPGLCLDRSLWFARRGQLISL